MNQINEMMKENVASTGDQKIKLNNFSKSIFAIICQKRQINDTDLMRYLAHQFCPVKQETLKRRKYDTINILEKADIIKIKKNNNTFTYEMKHDVPNSVKDLEAVKQRAVQVQDRIKQKKEKIKIMRLAQSNYDRLTELNKKRQSINNSIALPVIAVTQEFIEFSTQYENQNEVLRLKFPTGTKYITNVLANGELFQNTCN